MTLITPQIGSFYKPSAPVSSGYSFNMTAGDAYGRVGYEILFGQGSIDSEPISGYSLDRFIHIPSSSADSVTFLGDCLSLVSGLSIYVDGVFKSSPDWFVASGDTYASNDPAVFSFTAGNTYFVELKPRPTYSFTLNAVDYFGYTGYMDTQWNSGSISQEPIPGHILSRMNKNEFQNIITFEGDCRSLVNGLSIYVDGVFQTTPTWSLSSGDTSVTYDSPILPFVTGNTYFVELK